MQKGRISVRIIKCVLIGASGVGKTHLKFLLTGRKAPLIRISTPLAESPIRCISGTRIRLIDGGWKVINEEDLEEILATHIPLVCDELPDEVTPAELFDSLFHQQQSSDATRNKATLTSQEQAAATSQTTSTPQDENTTLSQDQATPTSPDQAPELATTSLLNDLIKRMIQLEGQRSSSRLKSEGEDSWDLSGSNWIHLIDSGGQPEFHNLLPIFIHKTSCTILVQRLCDSLNDYPIVEYYNKDGKRTGMPYRSSLTNLEILKSVVSTIHSNPTKGKHNKIIAVGTHKDKEKQCRETRAKKNEMLFDLLKPLFPDDLVLFGKAMELIFPVNTKNPDKHDNEVAVLLRRAIESSAPDPIDIPLWWYLLELALQRLAGQLDRKVLSRKECLDVAHQLGFSDKEFDAALRYFDELNLYLHYSVLPNVIFTDPQVPADKLSELVQYNQELREAQQPMNQPWYVWLMDLWRGKKPENPPEVLDSKWLRFRDQGIVRLEFLAKFRKHFRDGLFTPNDLLKLLEHLLILAPLSDGDYLMPALLQMLPPKELEKHRTFSQTAPLVILFPQGPSSGSFSFASLCPRGLFCCLIPFLMNRCQWKICHSSDAPTAVARNCIKFKIPGYPCSVTLMDSFAYFEVHIDINVPAEVCHEICPTIRQQIFSGIDEASETLHCNNVHPQPAFFCLHPKHGGRHSVRTKLLISPLHPATLSKDCKYLMCTEDEALSEEVDGEQMVWFGSTAATSLSGMTLYEFDVAVAVCKL